MQRWCLSCLYPQQKPDRHAQTKPSHITSVLAVQTVTARGQMACRRSAWSGVVDMDRTEPSCMQRMIVAHHHRKAGIIRHNHRAGVVGDFAIPGSIRVVGSRLDSAWVATHAWCMLAVFAVIFPAGIIWARYSRVRKQLRQHCSESA